MAKKTKKKVTQQELKEAEAKSRSRHPTAGGKSSTELDPQATLYTNDPQKFFEGGDRVAKGESIEQIWASALTDVAVIDTFRRMVADPKGWKKAQREALLGEAFARLRVLFEFKELVQEHINTYTDALYNREHGGLAQDRAIKAICDTLEHYILLKHYNRQQSPLAPTPPAVDIMNQELDRQ